MTRYKAGMNPILRGAVIAALLASAACSSIAGPTLPPAPPPRQTSTPAATGAAPETTPSITPGGPITLRVWVPPQFDPTQNHSAAALLRARLQTFTGLRPRMSLDVRVKAMNGPGGLLDALTTAGPAAPGVLPDLIALPRDLLEAAALKGMLTPYDPDVIGEAADDWYPFAAELGRLQDNLYGLPFAGDALALVYRSTEVEQAPKTWNDVAGGNSRLVFPAADPQALFALTMYQSKGGKIRDEAGKPILDTETLTDVLTYFAQAQEAGVMTDELTQYQDDSQVWSGFVDAGAQMASVWTSHYLTLSRSAEESIKIAALPTESGRAFTLATGWVWALPVRDPERQRIAVELALFLTEGSFLSTWTQTAGYLPPNPAALQKWEAEPARVTLDRIARSAHIVPPAEILVALSGPLWQATVDVLKAQAAPIPAAQKAAASLNGQ